MSEFIEVLVIVVVAFATLAVAAYHAYRQAMNHDLRM
jgi:Tfp pilus assembly protein PilE